MNLVWSTLRVARLSFFASLLPKIATPSITVYANIAQNDTPPRKTFTIRPLCTQYGVAVELKVKVKAASIVALSPSSYTLTVEAGENEQLKNAPQTVSALYTNSEMRDVAVTWDFESSNFDINTPGVYTVRGTVEGTSQKSTLSVTMKEAEVKPDHVKPFDDITVANDSGRPNTPDTATLVFTNSNESEVPAIWEPLSEEALTFSREHAE